LGFPFIVENPHTVGEKFARLVEIMARLRAPGGCPWDREQTFDTIKAYLLEEAYEVMETIDQRDWRELKEELGDLMLQPVFFAQMAGEQGLFSIGDSLDAINEKLIRRHPHVFSDATAETPEDVKKRWDEIKKDEKQRKGTIHKGLLDGVSRAQPSLMEAREISSRAARVGFDWENTAQVVDKLHEELRELADAGQQHEFEQEIGDLLFVLVNLARFHKVDPEQALRKTSAKFRKRFGYLEEQLAARGLRPEDSNIEEMERLWQEAKREA
jgi:MazG family protein